jgi:hypothetical protein
MKPVFAKRPISKPLAKPEEKPAPAAPAVTVPPSAVFCPQRGQLAWIAQALSEYASHQAPSARDDWAARANAAVAGLNVLVTAEDAKFKAVSTAIDSVGTKG